MTPLEILIAAREWLTQPDRWTKGASWKNAIGGHCKNRKEVYCTCVYGAISLMTEELELIENATHFLEKAVETEFANEWNDAPERTHAEVLVAFDRAIELAKENK